MGIGKRIDLRKDGVFYLYVVPLATLLILFSMWPIAMSIFMSFTKSHTSLSSNPEIVGFRNYVNLFQDERFWHSYGLTLLFAVLGVPLSLFVALCISLMIQNQYVKWGGMFFKFAVFIPVVIPGIVSATVWRWIFNEDFGVVNAVLSFFNLPKFGGISDHKTVFGTLLFIVSWRNMGFYAVLFMTNLAIINQTLYEAADIDGASVLQKIRFITMAELKPSIIINSVYALIEYLRVFEVAAVITRGGPADASNFISYFAYNSFKHGLYGKSTAMATVLFVTIIILARVVHYVTKGYASEE